MKLRTAVRTPRLSATVMGCLGVLCIVLRAVAAVAQTPPEGQTPVDISLLPYASHKASARLPDGRELHFVCMGRGSPTVILTAGAGADATDWRSIQPAIGRLTRVCAWDRPGFGLSDGTSQRQTVLTTTADLEAGLFAGSVRPPYVMVGHSVGAYETLMFADHNRAKVVGMVLIDPSFPDQLANFQKIFRPDLISSRLSAQQRAIEALHHCAAEARSGTSSQSSENERCLSISPAAPPDLTAGMRAKAKNPSWFYARATYLANAAASGAQVVNVHRNYGRMPLIVLTAGKPAVWPGMTEQEKALMVREWARAHESLARLSSDGKNIQVSGAGHSIQFDAPQAVIEAVETVVRKARGRQ